MLLDLTGKKILVTGIANNRSIAWGIAQQLKAAGAELGITYLPDDKGRFEAKVRELTAPLEPSLFLPLNVQDADQMAEVFGEIKEKWGVLDGLVHCLAFAGKEELIGDYSATTAEGFARSLDISAYSLAPLCAHAKPLFSEKAGVITLSYLGAERAIPNYNVMGVAKAALESSVRYLAADLGEKGIRVNAICPGFIATAIFAGQTNMNWDQRMEFIAELEKTEPANTPIQRAGKGLDIANMALFLASDASTFITGQAFVVDGGLTAGTRRVPAPDGVSRFQEIANRIQEGDDAQQGSSDARLLPVSQLAEPRPECILQKVGGAVEGSQTLLCNMDPDAAAVTLTAPPVHQAVLLQFVDIVVQGKQLIR